MSQTERQLMATFESARIQTAARAVGVAQVLRDYGLNERDEAPADSRAVHDARPARGE